MPSFLSGPFRRELPDGTLVYLDYDGNEECRCPRQHPDMPLPEERESDRWWRNEPLSRGINRSIWCEMSMSSIASSHNITVELAREICEKMVANGEITEEGLHRALLKDEKERLALARLVHVREADDALPADPTASRVSQQL